mmetsp:Transcript_5498/g.15254  ORF Transcript_5498/g.15254 Transcript_5498/m.15254 type:complete len:224 (+) Transcript_5498:61-732(+)
MCLRVMYQVIFRRQMARPRLSHMLVGSWRKRRHRACGLKAPEVLTMASPATAANRAERVAPRASSCQSAAGPGATSQPGMGCPVSSAAAAAAIGQGSPPRRQHRCSPTASVPAGLQVGAPRDTQGPAQEATALGAAAATPGPAGTPRKAPPRQPARRAGSISRSSARSSLACSRSSAVALWASTSQARKRSGTACASRPSLGTSMTWALADCSWTLPASRAGS